MVVAVNLVVEVLNTGPGRVIIHIHSMEGTLALDHHPNQLPAIRTVVQVRTKIRNKIVKKFKRVIIFEQFLLRLQ